MSIISRALFVKKLIFKSTKNPFMGQIFITRRCNLRCPFCAAPLHRYKELSPNQWCKALDTLSDLGVQVLSFVGGEPTLYKGLLDVLGYAHSKGFVTVLHSNMTDVKSNFVQRLANTGVDALEASIDSLNGILPKSSLHVLDILNEARDQGVIPIVCTVITKSNIEQVPEIAQRVTEAGFAYVVAVYQTVGGQFSTHNPALIPSHSEIERLFNFLIKIKKKTALIKNSYHFFRNPQIHNIQTWHCNGSEDTWIAIDSDGTVMPCQEYRSKISIFDFQKPYKVAGWRQQKTSITNACKGCSYHCYFESEEFSGIRALSELCSYALGLYRMKKVASNSRI